MIERQMATLKSKTGRGMLALGLILGMGAVTPLFADNRNDEDSVIRRSESRGGEDYDLESGRGRRRGSRRFVAPEESGGYLEESEGRDDFQTPRRVREDRSDAEIEWDNRFIADGKLRLSAFIIPFIDFDADKDTGEKRQDVHFDDSVRSGSGFGVRLGGGSSSKKDGLYFNLGLLYLFSQQETRNVRARVNAHQGYLDAIVGVRGGNRLIRAYLEGGLGVGGVALDFKRGLDDEGGAAAMARLGAGVTLFSQLSIGASYGVLEFGYPTETIGRAQFISIEIQFDF